MPTAETSGRHRIDVHTAAILRRSVNAAGVLRLPEQLKRSEHRRVGKALRALGGKWSNKAGGFRFAFDPDELLSQVDTGATATAPQATAKLVKLMAAFSRIEPGQLVLAPSSGVGALVELALARGASVHAVEADPVTVRQTAARFRDPLVDGRLVLFAEDFAAWANRRPKPLYDAAVLHPPMGAGLDLHHIRLAWRLLKPGGQLVAVCSAASFLADDAAARDLRREVFDADGLVRDLPRWAFDPTGPALAAKFISVSRLCGGAP